MAGLLAINDFGITWTKRVTRQVQAYHKPTQIHKKKRVHLHSPMGWVSYLHRAATTNYLCCGQALEDSLGAGRIGLTHTFIIYRRQR